MAVQASQLLSRLRVPNIARTVGLISDTHVPVRARGIPRKIFEVFEGVDFIAHAGDLVQLYVIDELEQRAPVFAVYGNMDGPEVRADLSRINSFNVFDWKIGVMHNPGLLFGMRKMREIAEKKGFDVLVYGHTHRPSIKWDGNRLFINPGSPTNPLPPLITKPSVALLRIIKEKIVPEIIRIK